MDAAIVTRPQAGSFLSAQRAGLARMRRSAAAAGLRRIGWHRPLLGVLLVVTFLLRLWGIKQGLPYSYNVDEATHFVPRAVAFFSHDLNPHYFLNPPAYSYLLHIVFELWFGSGDAVTRAYAADPTSLFVVARVVAAACGTLAVLFTYLAGARFFNRSVGLLAAALLGFAFLPIFYSHLALNDVPTLAPVTLALYAIAGVYRRGRRVDYALAGAGIGLAAATKYTGGITVACLLGAFICDASGEAALATAARRLVLAFAVGLLAFLLANPYALLDFTSFRNGISSQASLAAGEDPVKLGSAAGGGLTYYLWTFTWGLGWGPTIGAIAGAIILAVRRRVAMLLVLVPAPIVFIIFMGAQQRFFGRWLMPIFPIVVILGAYGTIEAVRWVTRATGLPASFAFPVATVLVLIQSFIAVVHDDAVLARPDTRNLTRRWMVSHIPAGSKVVIEPVVAGDWAQDVGTSLHATLTGERWTRWPTWLTSLDANGNPLPAGQRRYVLVDQYERVLYPALLDSYERGGYCWVVIGSLQAGRAFAQPTAAPSAIGYYAALASRGQLVYHVTPFSAGARSIPFSFDWSIDYYPRQYRRPGPEMSVYHLTGGRCAAPGS